MLRSKVITRAFYNSPVSQGMQLMTKLKKFGKDHVLLNKTDKEYSRFKENQQIKLKKHVKRPYPKQKVIQLLHERYDIPVESLKNVEIGPTSTQDIEIFRSINNNKNILLRDKRLLFTMLGVSGEQMRDGKLISDDVEKFLKRNQPEKALLLIRLANTNKSVVAMNKLIEYYLLEKNDCSTAISLFNWRKKWGISPNEESFTILFNGISKLPQKISKKNTESLINIIIGLIENKNLGFDMNEIHFNSAMSALTNSKDGKAIFELYDIRPKGIRISSITYTLLLKGFNNYYTNILGSVENEKNVQRSNDENSTESDASFTKFYAFYRNIVDRIPLRYMDDKLCFEMIHSLSSRGILETKDKLLKYKILSDCSNGLVHYFDFKDLIQEKHALEMIPKSTDLISKSERPFKKFKLNQFDIVLMLELLGENGSFKKMDELFNKMLLDENMNSKITPYVLETYFKYVIKGYGEICDEKMLKVLKQCDDIGSRRVFTKEIKYLMNTCFLKKMQNVHVLREEDKIISTFKTFFEYNKEFGSMNTGLSSENVSSDKKWYIYFEMTRRSKFLEKFGENKKLLQTLFLDEYIRSFIDGEFLIDDLSKYKSERDIQFKKDIDLKAINILKHIIYEIYGDEQSMSDEAKSFKKSISQLRDNLLKRCALMDVYVKNQSKKDVSVSAVGEITFETLNEGIKPALKYLRNHQMP